MIISDLQHLEIVSEETQIQGQGYSSYKPNEAYASGDSTAIAKGDNTYTETYQENNTYTDDYTSASNSKGFSYSFTGGKHR